MKAAAAPPNADMLERMVTAVKNAHKAIQVLKDENEQLKQENAALKARVEELSRPRADIAANETIPNDSHISDAPILAAKSSAASKPPDPAVVLPAKPLPRYVVQCHITLLTNIVTLSRVMPWVESRLKAPTAAVSAPVPVPSAACTTEVKEATKAPKPKPAPVKEVILPTKPIMEAAPLVHKRADTAGSQPFSAAEHQQLNPLSPPQRCQTLLGMIFTGNYRTVAKHLLRLPVCIVSKAIWSHLDKHVQQAAFMEWKQALPSLPSQTKQLVQLLVKTILAMGYDTSTGLTYCLDLFRDLGYRAVAAARARSDMPQQAFLAGWDSLSSEQWASQLIFFKSTLAVPVFIKEIRATEAGGGKDASVDAARTVAEIDGEEADSKKRRAEMAWLMGLDDDSEEDGLPAEAFHDQDNDRNEDDTGPVDDEEGPDAAVHSEEEGDENMEADVMDVDGEDDGDGEARSAGEEEGTGVDGAAAEAIADKSLRCIRGDDDTDTVRDAMLFQQLIDCSKISMLLQIASAAGWEQAAQQLLQDMMSFAFLPFAPGFLHALRGNPQAELLRSMYHSQCHYLTGKLSAIKPNKIVSTINFRALMAQQCMQVQAPAPVGDGDLQSFLTRGFWGSCKELHPPVAAVLGLNTIVHDTDIMLKYIRDSHGPVVLKEVVNLPLVQHTTSLITTVHEHAQLFRGHWQTTIQALSADQQSPFKQIQAAVEQLHNGLWRHLLGYFDRLVIGLRSGSSLAGLHLNVPIITKMHSLKDHLTNMSKELPPSGQAANNLILSKLNVYLSIHAQMTNAKLSALNADQAKLIAGRFTEYCSIRHDEAVAVAEVLDAITLQYAAHNTRAEEPGEAPEEPSQGASKVLYKLLKCHEDLSMLLVLFLVEKYVSVIVFLLQSLLQQICQEVRDAVPMQASHAMDRLSCAMLVLRILSTLPPPWSLASQLLCMTSLYTLRSHCGGLLKQRMELMNMGGLLSRQLVLRAPMALVINLDRRPDRWLKVLRKCAQWRMSACRVPAVDGLMLKDHPDLVPESDVTVNWNTSLNCLFDAKCVSNTVIALTNTERACAMSHLTVWKAIHRLYSAEEVAADEEVDALARTLVMYRQLSNNILSDYYLIFEDDVHIKLQDINTFHDASYCYTNSLLQELQYIISRLPPSTDICYLGGIVPKKSAAYKERRVKTLFVSVNYIWNLHAYLLNGKSVHKLLSCLPINMPVDNFLASLAHNSTIESLLLVKTIAEQGGVQERKHDSDIYHSGTSDKFNDSSAMASSKSKMMMRGAGNRPGKKAKT